MAVHAEGGKGVMLPCKYDTGQCTLLVGSWPMRSQFMLNFQTYLQGINLPEIPRSVALFILSALAFYSALRQHSPPFVEYAKPMK